MARRALWVVLLGAAAGCGDGTRAISTAKPVEEGRQEKAAVELTPEKKPDKSDPAAEAVVKAALDAHTGKKFELLQKLKSVRLVREGQVTMGGTSQVKQTWELYAGWPDRFRVKAEMPGPQVATLAWAGGGGWRHAVGVGKVVMSDKEVQDFRTDVTGEWLTLLFPLAEPETVVAPAPELKVNDRPAAGVRVWHPALSDAVLHFDKETKLLALVTYDGRESGQKVTKEVLVLGHGEFAGVTLPSKTVQKSNGKQLAEWTMTALEPKPQLDPKLFEEP
jgi:hypothetical protein